MFGSWIEAATRAFFRLVSHPVSMLTGALFLIVTKGGVMDAGTAGVLWATAPALVIAFALAMLPMTYRVHRAERLQVATA